jgi:multiple sugar transport system permease protein
MSLRPGRALTPGPSLAPRSMMRRNAKRASGIERRKARYGWSFVLPALAFFGLFSFYPIVNAFYTSLFKQKLLSLAPPEYIGFGNYVYLLHSATFWNSVRATAIFTACTFSLLVGVSLLLAAFITSRKRVQSVLQMVYFSPAVVSSVVAAAVWLLIFDPRGLGNYAVNTIMRTPGVDHKWLASAAMLRLSTVLVYFWKYVGYFTIIFIAGLTSIPTTLHEAAKIDGAGAWKDFWYVSFPLLKPTLVLVSVMSMIQCLRTFSTQYVFMQAGAPRGPIDVIAFGIYNMAIRDHQIGRASAMSVILFCIMLVLSWMQFRVSRSEDVSYL